MKINKTILVGLLFILFAGLIFITDAFNPIIRPITYLFLMGSSKGKDILFFGLLGLFLILSQLIKKDINSTKYLKSSIIIGSVLLILGILLEVMFRLQMGIGLNTVFCSMSSGMSSTSILHTHLLKSILGEVLTQIIGPFIQSDINTGVGLYSYVPNFGYLVILLIPILFVTMTLSLQKRPWNINLLLSFFSSCLIIGAIDGGLFGTPAIIGIIGLYFVYKCEYQLNYFDGVELNYKNIIDANLNQLIDKNVIMIILIVILIILLRFTIAFAGAEPDYYTVEIEDIDKNVDFGKIPITHFNNTTYHVTNTYNEMELINDLKVPLNNSCEYYTVSWNINSYFK